MLAIGVDRLDYSKGLPERFHGFERYLQRHPDQKGSLTYLQIAPVSRGDVGEYQQLRNQLEQIAGICGLNVFSTEIARDTRGVWLVVDYVNEPCDFRLQSKVVNGVPDAIVAEIANAVAGWLARRVASRV